MILSQRIIPRGIPRALAKNLLTSFELPRRLPGSFRSDEAYAQSKLAQVLFTREMRKRLLQTTDSGKIQAGHGMGEMAFTEARSKRGDRGEIAFTEARSKMGDRGEITFTEARSKMGDRGAMD